MKVYEFNVRKVYSEGSGTCAVINKDVVMELNEYGYYEEKILLPPNDSVDSDILFVSPNFNETLNETDISNKLYGSRNYCFDNRIGYYHSLYVGHVTEGDYRLRASSGGFGTWIFKELFEKNLIDGVVHVKKNPDISSPILFQYDISRSIQEIQDGAKTKYYPVELSRVLKIVREVEGRYAIIGIPSFIMAVRLLCEKDEIMKSRIKYTVGLICGHQKSSKFADFLAWQVGIKPGDLINIDFRKKLLNMNADDYGVEITGYVNNEEIKVTKPKSELYGQDWGQGYFKLFASDFTDDVFNETADITIGDAWISEYTADSLGNNVIIVRDNLINDLLLDGVNSGRVKLTSVDKEAIFQSQSAHYRHTHDELAYRLYKMSKSNIWHPRKRMHASNKIPFMRRKIQDLRQEISTKSHIIFNQAIDLDDLSYFIDRMEKLSKKYNRLYFLQTLHKRGFLWIIKAICRRMSIPKDRRW